MKRRILIGFMVCVALCCLYVAALADTDPLKISMELSQTKFTTTQDITVSITVTNVGEGDMPGPVTLYYPNGQVVEEFGSPTLAVGASQSWSGTWSVTQKQLEAGKITFKAIYSMYNDDGELTNKTKNFAYPITYASASAEEASQPKVQVEVNRTILPTVAEKGQEVNITYDVVNAGEAEITDVTIKENSSISKSTGTIASIPAGEKASYTFTVTMGTKNLTSQSTITYKANGKTYATQKDKATIKYGQVNLSATLEANKKGGAPGEVVTLTLTLKNTGKVNFTNINVTDPTLGTVLTNVTLEAGKTQTYTKEVAITESADYLYTITATDADEQETVTSTGKVSVTAVSPEDQVILSVSAQSDRGAVYSLPGTVKFTVSITNQGANEVKDVYVSASGVQLYHFPTIAAGETRSFSRDVSVSMAGQYQFVATCKNLLQEDVTFQSNIISIMYAQPTAVPTDAPIVTPPQPDYVETPTTDGLPEYVDTVQQALDVVWTICAVLAVVSAGLLCVGLVRRMQQKAQSAKAYDHLERGTYRDYTTPAPKEKSKGKAAKGGKGSGAKPADASVTMEEAGDMMESAQEEESGLASSAEEAPGADEWLDTEDMLDEAAAAEAAQEDLDQAEEMPPEESQAEETPQEEATWRRTGRHARVSAQTAPEDDGDDQVPEDVEEEVAEDAVEETEEAPVPPQVEQTQASRHRRSSRHRK